MTTNYSELRQHLEDRVTQFGREMPGPMSGFARLHKKAVEDGTLSAKVKEMMALAISIAVGCEGCIAYHVHDAIQAGATRAELLETIGIGVMTLAPALRFGASAGVAGGPGTLYAAHALDAVDQFLAESVTVSG
jgi:AhpD family alkylhydroperoxidase